MQSNPSSDDKGLLINVLISFGICSAPKLSKWVTSLFICKATQGVPISEYSLRFII